MKEGTRSAAKREETKKRGGLEKRANEWYKESEKRILYLTLKKTVANIRKIGCRGGIWGNNP